MEKDSLRTFLISKRRSAGKLIAATNSRKDFLFFIGGITGGFLLTHLILAPLSVSAADIVLNGMPQKKQPSTLFQYVRSYGSSKAWFKFMATQKPTEEFTEYVVKPLFYSVKPLACFAAGSVVGGFLGGKLAKNYFLKEADECHMTLSKSLVVIKELLLVNNENPFF